MIEASAVEESPSSWFNPRRIIGEIASSAQSCGQGSLKCVWNTGSIVYDYGYAGFNHIGHFTSIPCQYMVDGAKIVGDTIRSPVTRSVTRRFALGFSKPFTLSGVAMGLHSYIAHGEHHEALTDEEIAAYLAAMLSVSVVMGASEAALYFRPILEVRWLPLYNAVIQGLDSVALKYLLIFDNDCREIYQPTCGNYNKLITVSEYALAPILILATFSAYSEYAKYNTVKAYLTNGQGDNIFVKYPKLQQTLVAIDSGISLVSFATTIISFVNLYRMFFLQKNSFVAEDLQIYLKFSAFLVGGLVGSHIAEKNPNQLKKVFCFNEFNQTFILNLAATSINFVVVYMLSVDHGDRGISVLSDNKRANIGLFVYSVGGSLFNSALRVHDEYSYKYPTQSQLEKVYTRHYRARHGQELRVGRSAALFFSTQTEAATPQRPLLQQREEREAKHRTRTLSGYLTFK